MGRAPCCDKANVKRGPWSPEEDATLKSYLNAHGAAGNWIALPRKAGLRRCGKSCRLRWLNYLRPNIKHGGFTEDEDRTICELFNQMGSRWSVIASHLPGRTDNDVKNYWNTKLKKKLFSGQITLSYQNPSNTSSINTAAIDAHHQKPSHGRDFVPKLEADDFSSPYPEPGTTQEHATWRSALTDHHVNCDINHGLVTANDHEPSLMSYDQSSLFIVSPRVFMAGLSEHYHEFDTVTPKINGHVMNHMSLLSADQSLEGSNVDGAPSNSPLANGVKSGDGCEGLYVGNGGTTMMMDFGFGLPYDIVF